jgi:hypothetical protein
MNQASYKMQKYKIYVLKSNCSIIKKLLGINKHKFDCFYHEFKFYYFILAHIGLMKVS